MTLPGAPGGRSLAPGRVKQLGGRTPPPRRPPPAVPLGYSTYAELLGAFVSVKEAAVSFCDYTIKKPSAPDGGGVSERRHDGHVPIIANVHRSARRGPARGPNTSHFKGPSDLHSVWEPGSERVPKTSPRSRDPDQDPGASSRPRSGVSGSWTETQQ